MAFHPSQIALRGETFPEFGEPRRQIHVTAYMVAACDTEYVKSDFGGYVEFRSHYSSHRVPRDCFVVGIVCLIARSTKSFACDLSVGSVCRRVCL